MIFGGKKKRNYIELAIYSEKITKDDYSKFFTNLIKRRIPFLGVIDLSDLISWGGVRLVIKRYNNTIKLFIEEKDSMYSQSSLFFPFHMSEPKDVQLIKSHFSLGTYFMFGGNLFDFLVKEGVEELRVSIVKVLGGFYAHGSTVSADGHRSFIFIANPLKFFEIDLEKNPAFYIELLDPIPKAIQMDSDNPIFDYDNITIGADNFSALQHTLLTGTSGSGKSKLLEILIKAVSRKYGDNVRIVVIDPHSEFSKAFEDEKIVDFVHNYVEPLDVGKDKSPLITQLVAQLITSTLAQENKYAERVVFYAVHLLSSINELTLGNINLLLTDSAKRTEFSSRCENDEVRRFFDEEFQDIYMHHFNDAILPVINFIGEYMLYLGKERKLESLAKLIEKNRIVVVSFNPHFFGRRVIRFFAGAIINQMYMLAIGEKLSHPTVLVVDEFPVVETRVVKDILAETRKFNLFVYVSGQYLGQISKVVLDALISNARNIISFRVTREDARLLSSMMEIKVEEFFKRRVSPSELEEAKREMFIKLHPRECIVRLFDGEKFILPMKVRTADLEKWKSA
jgi:energy-coupling factor transporter ATP-binding protein EcfA2